MVTNAGSFPAMTAHRGVIYAKKRQDSQYTRPRRHLLAKSSLLLVFAQLRLHLLVVDGPDLRDLTALVFDDHRIEMVAHRARGARQADVLGELQVDAGRAYRDEVRLIEGCPHHELRIA